MRGARLAHRFPAGMIMSAHRLLGGAWPHWCGAGITVVKGITREQHCCSALSHTASQGEAQASELRAGTGGPDSLAD